MTYYMQLKPIVLSYLTDFKTDFTTLDKKQLQNYQGGFLYSIRKTGTDLFKFNRDISFLDTDYKKTIEWGYTFLMRTNNERFFIGQNGKIKEVKKDVLQSEFLKFIQYIARLKADYVYVNSDCKERDLLELSELSELKKIIGEK